MFHVTMDGDGDVYTHAECTKGRRIKDDGDEARMATYLKQHGVFHNKVDTLQNMINNDLVTVSIEESLLGAECLGKKKLNEFVEKRICLAPDNDQHVDLKAPKAPIRKNKAVTFASLYTVVQDIKVKQSTIKMNRNILQRLIMAYRAVREVNLDNILQHKLMSVPLSIATISRMHSLTKDVLTPSS